MPSNLLCWIDIPVTDLDRAAAFYSAVLGKPVTKHTFGAHQMGLLPHREGSPSGSLVAGPNHQPSRTGPLIYLSVEGRLDDAVLTVVPGGGDVLEPRHPIGPNGFRAIILDSEGNRIALHSMV